MKLVARVWGKQCESYQDRQKELARYNTLEPYQSTRPLLFKVPGYVDRVVKVSGLLIEEWTVEEHDQ